MLRRLIERPCSFSLGVVGMVIGEVRLAILIISSHIGILISVTQVVSLKSDLLLELLPLI